MTGGLGSGRAALGEKGHLLASLLLWRVWARNSSSQDRMGRRDGATDELEQRVGGPTCRTQQPVHESQQEGEDKPITPKSCMAGVGSYTGGALEGEAFWGGQEPSTGQRRKCLWDR